MNRQSLFELLKYLFAFSSGLLLGYVIVHEFLLLGMDNMPIIDYGIKPLLRPGFKTFVIIVIRNSQFSMAIYLLGFNRVIQYMVMFIAGLISGFLLSPLSPWCAALGVMPHGAFELVGYSLAGLGGYSYFSLRRLSLRVSMIRYLIPSLLLITIAAFIETFITMRVISIICSPNYMLRDL